MTLLADDASHPSHRILVPVCPDCGCPDRNHDDLRDGDPEPPVYYCGTWYPGMDYPCGWCFGGER